ncbi:MAG: flagellar biosynthesis protein FlhA [Candidatus Lariskella arthropodorum]
MDKILDLNLTNARNSIDRIIRRSAKRQDVFFAVGILCIISVLLFPVPPLLLDLLLSTSLTFSVLILMTVLFIDKPLEFNAFPSLLLVVTMLRLSLNVSTTRLILANGHLGTDAAGHVVRAFGDFMMQGSIMIGIIIFTILTIINFVVITKGSGRIAEVAARFSLDGMPGKQMAIDSDLSAGLIDEAQAKMRRQQLEGENTFFGAMDGANKFVRGDAVAGILIIFINLIGGIIIGILQKDMTFDKAMHTYTILTVGDGLVTQIPAIIVSISAGLLVTKSGVRGSADKAIIGQLIQYPKALSVTAGLLLFMACIPGIPVAPFSTCGAIMATISYFLYKTGRQAAGGEIELEGESGAESMQMAGSAQAQQESVTSEQVGHIDNIKLELGYDLLPLINNTNFKITDQIKGLRKQLLKDLGFTMPSVRIQDNIQLPQDTYIIKIKEIECGRGVIKPNKLMVMESKGGDIDMMGDETREPAFGLSAKWIDEIAKDEALLKGYTVVEPSVVIATHLTEVIKENISELITYVDTQRLLDNLAPEQRKLASEIIPVHVSVIVVQRVIQGLLSEGISIRDFATILEAIAEVSTGVPPNSQNATKIVEHVRVRLAKQICNANMNDKGYIPIVVLSPAWEQAFRENIVGEGDNRQLVMPPSKLQEFVGLINAEFEKHAVNGEVPVILTSPMLRPFIRAVVERFRSNIAVMSHNEIHAKAKLKTLGQI